MKFLMYGKQVFFLMMLFMMSSVFGMELGEVHQSKPSPLFQFFGIDADHYNAVPEDIKDLVKANIYDRSKRRLWYSDQVASCVEKDSSSPTVAWQVCFDNAQNQLVMASGKSVGRFDMHTKKRVLPTLVFDDIVKSLCCDNPGKHLVVAIGEDRDIYITEGTAKTTLHHDDVVTSVCFDSAGDYLATGSCDGKARIFDIKTKQLMETLMYPRPVFSVSLSGSGKRLAIAQGLSVHVIDTKTWEKFLWFGGTPNFGTFYSTSLNFVGNCLAAGGSSCVAYLYDIENQELFKFQQNNVINLVCFDPSGNYLAIGTSSKVIIIDVQAKQEIASFDYGGCVNSMCFDKSSNYLATGGVGKAEIFACHNTYTLEQLMILKIINLWLRTCKQSQMIGTVDDFFGVVADMFTAKKEDGEKEKEEIDREKKERDHQVDVFFKELMEVWKTFPLALQGVMWKFMQKTIKQHGICPYFIIRSSCN